MSAHPKVPREIVCSDPGGELPDSESVLVAARLAGSGRLRRRLLVIGDEKTVSTNSASPTAFTLSTALAVRGQRPAGGVDLDVLWGLLPALRAIDAGSASCRLWRYDAVIVVLSAGSDSSARMERVILRVLIAVAQAGPLLLVIPDRPDDDPPGQVLAHWSDGLLQQLADAGLRAPVAAAGIDEQGRFSEPVAVAEEVLHLLDQVSIEAVDPLQHRRSGPQGEAERQAATDRSIHALGGVTSDLMRVVLLARNTFDMPYAQINLVSQGRLHSVAFAGRSSHALTGTLSAMVVDSSEALLIEDTRTDSRCVHIEETLGPDAIRCYLGYPIESVDGYRIGTLCVFDTVPHPIDIDDDVLIRDLALLAEAEIGALTPSV